MRFNGTVTTWNDARGFGFIAPTQGDQEVFFHVTACNGREARPEVGQAVSFEVELNSDGKKRARLVEPWRGPRPAAARRRGGAAQWGTATDFAILAFLVLYLVASFLWHVPGWVPGVYVGASVLTFVIYAADKSAAVADSWRVSESALLTLGFVGGWPGAIVAQQVLGHKSSKASFRSAFWGAIVTNVAAFLLVFSPLGRWLWQVLRAEASDGRLAARAPRLHPLLRPRLRAGVAGVVLAGRPRQRLGGSRRYHRGLEARQRRQ